MEQKNIKQLLKELLAHVEFYGCNNNLPGLCHHASSMYISKIINPSERLSLLAFIRNNRPKYTLFNRIFNGVTLENLTKYPRIV